MMSLRATIATAITMFLFSGTQLMSQTTAPSSHDRGDHHAVLKNADGSWRFTNALAKESSPYLLQHAHNPVDWHAWGAAAFELARTGGKPIFLSVGYSTCYWCHVMERQVFENPEIAKLMNEHFINIKVDREERPDVDDIYMTAVQVMTGRGGWPMSVFLTPPGAGGKDDPGLKPFYCGTYFPPEPSRGMPGFPQVVLGLAKAWRDQRHDVLEQSSTVAAAVTEHLGDLGHDDQPTLDLVQTAANRLIRQYDHEHGGFGSAPKFPTPSNLFFLLEVHRNNPAPELWNAFAHTLDRMARGGMYDQIGGGFHRYSTDEKWLVPHFEKMLYDNGQLLEVYARAQAVRPDAAEPGLYPRVVRQTCEYVLREMTDKSGAFWSAQDAEVDAREGGNYVWRPEEVDQAITDKPLAAFAKSLYGLDKGPNFQDPHHEDEPPSNVLYLPQFLSDVARDHELAPEQVAARKEHVDAALLAVRSKRKQPMTDDKVLTSWNGMMIAGMARAGVMLGEPRYTAAAARGAQAVLARMATPDGGLLRTMRGDTAKIHAFLDDYAFFIHGLLELHRATKNLTFLDHASRLAKHVIAKFGPESAAGKTKPNGGYFDTPPGQGDLFVRTRSSYDGALPSGNSQMIHNLLDLFEFTNEQVWIDQAVRDLRAFTPAMRRTGAGMAHMHGALLRAMELAPDKLPAATTQPDANGKRMVFDADLSTRRIDLAKLPVSFDVIIKLGPDYHANAHQPGVEGLIPTELVLENAPGLVLEVEYPKGAARKYPFAKDPIYIYEKQTTLRATLKRDAKSAGGATSPRLVLRVQVCTDMSCLEPRMVELPMTFE